MHWPPDASSTNELALRRARGVRANQDQGCPREANGAATRAPGFPGEMRGPTSALPADLLPVSRGRSETTTHASCPEGFG